MADGEISEKGGTIVEVCNKTNDKEPQAVIVFHKNCSSGSFRPPSHDYLVWKAIELPHGENKMFRYPSTVGLEADIDLADGTQLRVTRRSIPIGTKWKIQEEKEEKVGESSQKFVLKPADIPTRFADRTPKTVVEVENHLPAEPPRDHNSSSKSIPKLTHLKLIKGGKSAQIVPDVHPGAKVTYRINQTIYIGITQDLVEGQLFGTPKILMGYTSIALEDFNNGVRIEIAKNPITSQYFFTAHSQLTEMPDYVPPPPVKTPPEAPESMESFTWEASTTSLSTSSNGHPVPLKNGLHSATAAKHKNSGTKPSSGPPSKKAKAAAAKEE